MRNQVYFSLSVLTGMATTACIVQAFQCLSCRANIEVCTVWQQQNPALQPPIGGRLVQTQTLNPNISLFHSYSEEAKSILNHVATTGESSINHFPPLQLLVLLSPRCSALSEERSCNLQTTQRAYLHAALCTHSQWRRGWMEVSLGPLPSVLAREGKQTLKPFLSQS